MPQPDADRTMRVGEIDTVGIQFHGSDLPDGVTISSATVAVEPGAASDATGDTNGESGVITGMTDTSDFTVGDPVTVSAGFPTTGPYTILSKTATSVTVDEDSDSEETDVTVARAAGLVLGSGTGLITADEDAAYAWVEAVRAGMYDVTFTVTFSDSKVLIRIYRVRVIDA